MQEHRKLAAIMFTDIVGYTAMMAKDEHKALGFLKKHRDVTKLLVPQFSGEWLKEMGDGTLSSFGSVVDAVNCALEIQNSLRDEAELKIRIGIHIGDVVVEEGDVFGDGVNVASRIEKLAEPGGICISERVYYDIKNKPVLEATFLGEKKLKNVDDPVKIYSLTRGGTAATAAKLLADEQIKSRKGMSRNSKIIVTLIVILFGIAGYALYSRFTVQTPVPEQEGIKSIAVLPFEDMSPEKDQGHFCDGIAETIINSLSKIEDLRVIARTSSFKFKGKEIDIRDIGKQLDVDTVLEGSVQKSGNRIRITAQLVKVEDNSHLFSEQYDKPLGDIFAIQDSISLAVLKELKFTLMGKEKAAIVKHYTNDPDAYELYLQGRYIAELGRESEDKAREYFQQAIDKDPDFALAYAGLAIISPKEEKGVLVKKALELDENLSEAYAQLALFSLGDWDFSAAQKSAKRAIELNPGYSGAHEVYSRYLRVMGRYEEALEEVHRAQVLNPLAFSTYGQAISLYLRLGKYDEARAQFNKAMEMNPESGYAKHHLARVDYLTGNYEKALEYHQGVLSENPEYPITSHAIAYIHALSGKRDKAEEMLQELIMNSSTELNFFWIAHIYTALGDRDNAFKWLEKVYEKKHEVLIYLKSDPECDPLRSDPRFKELTDKIGLP